MTDGHPRLRIFVGIIVSMIVTASLVGLFIAGSPGKERERRFDEQRVNNLQRVSSIIDMHNERVGRLPYDLGEITATRDSVYGTEPMTDPATGEPYDYNVTGEDTYELCATFDQESTGPDGKPVAYPRIAPIPSMVPMILAPIPKDWRHPAGYHCFSLTAQVYEMRLSCGLERPCPTGETCAVLPDQSEAFCIPQGKECISAGCPGKCTILESYPVQVRCPVSEASSVPLSDGKGCTLRRDPSTPGAVDCFGCAGTVCTTPGPGWEPWDGPDEDGYVGIPYSCYETPDGCALAQ